MFLDNLGSLEKHASRVQTLEKTTKFSKMKENKQNIERKKGFNGKEQQR